MFLILYRQQGNQLLEFEQNVLPKEQVEKIVVVNKETAEIYIKPDLLRMMVLRLPEYSKHNRPEAYHKNRLVDSLNLN